MLSRESAPSTRGIPAAAVAAGLVALSFVVYGNTLRGDFVWDDASSILLHRHVKDPAHILDLFAEDQHAFAGGQGNFYRPLLSVTFMVDYALARVGQPPIPPDTLPDDLSPALFHVSSIAWHAAAAVLLFLFLRRAGAPEAVQLIAATVFAVHPLHTEAVAYISGRADSMAAAFMFAGLWFFTWDGSGRRRNAGVTLGAAAYIGALLSKESAFAFPALVALSTAMLPRARSMTPAQRWTPFGVSAIILGVYAILRSTVLSFGSETESRASALGPRIIETLQSFALYMKLLFAPANLHMERTLDGVPGYTAAIGGILLIGVIGAIVICSRSGRARAAFGFAWFIVTWLPISGLFPLNAPMAEHWMYVPMAGFFWGVAELAFEAVSGVSMRIPPLRWAAAAVLAVWIIGIVSVTVLRNRDWRSNEALYVATLRENPDSIRVQFNLAVAYQDLLDNPPGAIRHFENVIAAYRERKSTESGAAGRYWADEIEAYLSLGDLYRELDRIDLAIPRYQTLLTIQPDAQSTPLVARAAYGLGTCYLAIGEYSAALGAFRRAAQLAPELGPLAERAIASEAPLATFAPLTTGATNP